MKSKMWRVATAGVAVLPVVLAAAEPGMRLGYVGYSGPDSTRIYRNVTPPTEWDMASGKGIPLLTSPTFGPISLVQSPNAAAAGRRPQHTGAQVESLCCTGGSPVPIETGECSR